jgi:sugar/nucleoside kinase (ribokinase family)
LNGALAVFGNLSIDDLVFVDGSTRWATPGGNAMYAGLGITVWTDQAIIVAPVGSDYPLDRFKDRVDVSRCPLVPKTLRSWGLYEEDGSRHFIFRNNTREWKDFCPSPEAAASGSQVAAHVAPMPWVVALSLIAELRKAGTQIIAVDLDERDLHDRAFEKVAELVQSSDLFLPSRQEARAIFPGAEPVEALRRLRALGPDVALIAIKCGADGVIGHAAGSAEFIQVPAVPVELVDATGGGDSFCGGVLAGFTQTKDVVEALLCGVVSASFCVEGLGLECLVAATKEEALSRLSVVRERVTFHPM